LVKTCRSQRCRHRWRRKGALIKGCPNPYAEEEGRAVSANQWLPRVGSLTACVGVIREVHRVTIAKRPSRSCVVWLSVRIE
jgi:hypothetical protein